MKSLEIVNEMVDYWENAVNVACQSNAENGYYDELDIVEYQNRLKKYQQIKADLEVLEIIDKKDVDIRELKLLCFGILNNGIGTIEDTLKVYNNPRSPKCQLTLEELLKIKQWLEENE